jgi:hypothetical protein
VWKRLVIRNRFGVPYLERLRIVETPWFGVYLHHIKGPDPQPDPHDHPWTFISLVLAGSYTEQVWQRVGGIQTRTYVRRWLPLTVHRMRGSIKYAHRITTCDPHTLTLILRGPRRREWGFWDIAEDGKADGWTHWKEYEK